MRDLLFGFLAALLPAPERGDFARRHGVDPTGWSGLLGLVEFLGGGALVLSNGLAHFQGIANQNAAILVEQVDPNQFDASAKLAYSWSGALIWLHWIVQPWTWVLISIPAVGIVRMIAYGVNQEAIGEP